MIVDWSANNAPKLGSDSIWLYRCRGSSAPVCENVATRFDAMARIEGTIQAAVKLKKRLFIGLDFGFGYPSGSAAVMANGVSGKEPWLDVWNAIGTRVEDSEENQSNRFDVASQFNALFQAAFREQPFWGMPHAHAGRYENLGPKRSTYEAISEKRIVEKMLPSAQPQWKLAYTGSVGSQSLLGIAHLARLRNQYSDAVAIWPFETRFADDMSKPVVIAEIYPSMLPVTVEDGEVKDAAQVRTMAEAFARLDLDGELETLLSAPACLNGERRADVLREEGWIVGVGHDFAPAQTVEAASSAFSYIRDPAEIYRQSFATVEAEAGLDSLPDAMRPIAMRLIHSCGMVDVVDDLAFSHGAAELGTKALAKGAAVFCDVEMVRSGVIARLLPASNEVVCTLNDAPVADHAKTIGNTRSAAAVDFWDDRLDGAVVAVGNAPTALFRLMERIAEGGPKPALVIGIPVGFVGAVESKAALAANDLGLNYITVHGRRGGSAMASAVVNALAGGLG